jgi:hypothetical protein
MAKNKAVIFKNLNYFFLNLIIINLTSAKIHDILKY